MNLLHQWKWKCGKCKKIETGRKYIAENGQVVTEPLFLIFTSREHVPLFKITAPPTSMYSVCQHQLSISIFSAPDSAQGSHVFHTQLHIVIRKTHIRFLIQLSLHSISLSSSKLCAFAAETSGQPTLIWYSNYIFSRFTNTFSWLSCSITWKLTLSTQNPTLLWDIN